MKYEDIVSELLVALRGNHSPIELSKAMGYNYNQVRRWEMREKQFRWDEFCLYCNAVEIPLNKVLSDVFCFQAQDPMTFLSFLHANRFPLLTIDELSEKLHRHPSAIRRYLEGEIFPDLEFVLAYIDLDYNRLAHFVLRLLPPGSSSALTARFEPDIQMPLKEAEFPLASAIEGWLATQFYGDLATHDDEFIAKRVGSTADEVKRILETMLKAGTVKCDSNGKYSLTYNSLLLPNGEKGSQFRFYKYWSERAASRLRDDHVINHGPVKGAGLCRVAAVSKDTSKKLNEILMRTDAEIRMLLEKAEDPCEDVRVITFNIFSTQDF